MTELKNRVFLEKAKRINWDREKDELKIKFDNMREDIEVI